LGPEHVRRFSLCCAQDGCRTRDTPSSLRFLGRKVFLGAMVVLISAMQSGLNPVRMKRLKAPAASSADLPASLLQSFDGAIERQLILLLRFLAPITTGRGILQAI
jgi:hypothetical protein